MTDHPVVATYTISVIARPEWGGYEAAMFTASDRSVGRPQYGPTEDEAVRRLMANVIRNIDARAGGPEVPAPVGTSRETTLDSLIRQSTPKEER